MKTHKYTPSQNSISLLTLLPYLLITFGITWGIVALYIFLRSYRSKYLENLPEITRFFSWLHTHRLLRHLQSYWRKPDGAVQNISSADYFYGGHPHPGTSLFWWVCRRCFTWALYIRGYRFQSSSLSPQLGFTLAHWRYLR